MRELLRFASKTRVLASAPRGNVALVALGLGLELAVGLGSGGEGFGASSAWAQGRADAREAGADWSTEARVPPGGRPNILGLDPVAFEATVERGKVHALSYPVEATGALFPYQALIALLDAETREPNPFRWILRKVGGSVAGLRSFADVERLVGVVPYPAAGDTGTYAVPNPVTLRPGIGMGTTLIGHGGGVGLTWSCAACHAGRLFGKTVLGLNNRFPKANDFFLLGQAMTSGVGPGLFRAVTRASNADVAMYERLRVSVGSIGAKAPLVEGLDTSLAQVGLSLSKRRTDPMATRDGALARRPAPNLLDDAPADSKPAVWWTAKYKTRWLSDGSVISGNPIYTNILWNEIGRGADLVAIDAWLGRNPGAIDALAAMVFASRAPRWTDFFPASGIDEAKARDGESLFNGNCARCHGTYVKAWDDPGADAMDAAARLATRKVIYHEKTPVLDVGTDLHRARGMAGLADGLNRLAISKRNGVVVKVQAGYVPPPLEGVWARWPYFHNGSVPSLCAVLTRSTERPKVFHAGEANDPARDFDSACVGYPTGGREPRDWRTRAERTVDTSRRGLGNQGHDEGIFLDGGVERYTPGQKAAIVEFLKTL